MASYHLHSEYMSMRKGRKLLAEKRRRGRINQCLDEIKEIVCRSTQRNDPNYDKMEKAEILETTVDYLRNVRKITRTQQETKEVIQARFHQGFSKCAEEMLSYIQSAPGVSDNVHRQLRKHLSRRLSSHVQQEPVTSPSPQPVAPCHLPSPHHTPNRQRSEVEASTHGTNGLVYASMNSVIRSPAAVLDTSNNDSGYPSSPEISRYFNLSGHSAGCVSDSELYMAEHRMPTSDFDHSRVREWLRSSWTYGQQVKVEQSSPWRPW